MKIIWDKVTKLSQFIAIVLFVGIFCTGIFLGRKVGVHAVLGTPTNDDWFQCDAGRSIHAVFYPKAVHVALSDTGREEFLLQTISASGARYANPDESLVFWNKGNTAMVMHSDTIDTGYSNCKVAGM